MSDRKREKQVEKEEDGGGKMFVVLLVSQTNDLTSETLLV